MKIFHNNDQTLMMTKLALDLEIQKELKANPCCT